MNIHYLTDRLPGPNYEPLETDANYRTEFGVAMNESPSKESIGRMKRRREDSITKKLQMENKSSSIKPSKPNLKSKIELGRQVSKSPIKKIVKQEYIPRELSKLSREKPKNRKNLPSLKAGKKPIGRNHSKELLLGKGGNHMKLEKVSSNFYTF